MNLTINDPEIANIINQEYARQSETLCLIASENYASNDVISALGTVLTNKYAEGYPGARYYNGCAEIDKIESIAIDRAKKLFNVQFANVQPHSGSQANQAVFLALLKPGDTILSMSLDNGGHLTHGSRYNQTGKLYNIISYNLNKEGDIDYEDMLNKAMIHKPKIIIAGFSAFSRNLNFRLFKEASDKADAILMVDMAHFAGMVAAGLHKDMQKYADIITSTTHKTLRGPRGGIILTNDEKLAKKIDRALFPGIQGGPLMNVIAAKAVAFKEAMSNNFKEYIYNVLDYAHALSDILISRGYNVVGGKTENHIVMIDYTNKEGVTGHNICEALERCAIICNKNMVPNDPQPPRITSGIRLGTAALVTRGVKKDDIITIAHMIADISDNILNSTELEKAIMLNKATVASIASKYPL